MERKGFVVPGEAQRKLALGDLSKCSNRVRQSIEVMAQYFKPIPAPGPSDWLKEHQEAGQTFTQYEDQKHDRISAHRNIIIIQPLDIDIPKSFLTGLQNYCQVFFLNAKVKVAPAINLQSMNVQKRINEYTGKVQYNAGLILKLLEKQRYKDSFCVLGITTRDLYPRKEWNYVFGLASLTNHTGVFSFARYDERFFEEKEYEFDYEKMLSRSLKVMVHQVSHMFGLKHCIYYSCVMNGSNHLEEGKKKPLELCPVCLRKLQSSLQFDILQRYKGLLEHLPKESNIKSLDQGRANIIQIVEKLEKLLK